MVLLLLSLSLSLLFNSDDSVLLKFEFEALISHWPRGRILWGLMVLIIIGNGAHCWSLEVC